MATKCQSCANWKHQAKVAERRAAEAEQAMDAWRVRAERAERGIGLGTCAVCHHWQRERQAFWGYCTLTEKIVGLDWPWRGEPNQRIATKENFGCIRFEERKPA